MDGSTLDFVAPPLPIGWYVHLPFCTTKCGYCDFYSLPTIPALIDDLVDALRLEMTLNDPRRRVTSVFIGGGTPTELPYEALGRVLDAVVAHTGLVEEWTVEANPTSASELKLETLIARGVNRISFGAQSFDAEELKILDRRHDPVHIAESVATARRVGFDNINIDLIYAIPGQTLGRWRDNLRRAIELETDHLSCYSLMYEKGTSLTRLREQGSLTPCDEELEADMFQMTIDELSTAGFEHYEISNFAKPGRRCKANMLYWENREYLGIGPSAVSFLKGVRRKNVPDVRRYIECMRNRPQLVVMEQEQLGPAAFAGETAVQMLRLVEGIQVERFAQRTGFDPRLLFEPQIEKHTQLGFIRDTGTAIHLTRAGMLLANRVMADFLVESESPITNEA